MYGVKEGARVKVVKWDRNSFPQIYERNTKRFSVYDIEDLAVDPTGVSRHHASIPQHTTTVGGDWAAKGYYGFRLPKNAAGWDIMLVSPQDVEYDGVPVLGNR